MAVGLTLAVAMMFPLGTGFSAGQAGVVKVSLWGIGMARSLYQSTIQAIGPDAMPIAQPMIPGTKTVVAGLIQSEMCRALINAASGQPNMVPAPSPVTGTPVSGAGGYVTWSYSLAAGNETAPPVCGTVTIREPLQGATNLGGVSVDMAGTQMAILSSVIAQIRPVAESVARSLWQTRQSSSLDPLMALLTSASANYTQQLTQAATSITQSLRSGLQAADARTGSIGLQHNQTRLQALGWTGAGAYYLEIARLNGTTLSLLSATPVLNAPSYLGPGPGLASDIAPLQAAVLTFSDRIMTYAETTDGMEVAGGNADLFSGATPGEDGAGAIEQVVRKLHISERVLNAFLSAVAPTGLRWADPFAALIDLGQKMVLIAVTALGAAGTAGVHDGKRRGNSRERADPEFRRGCRNRCRAPHDEFPRRPDFPGMHGAARAWSADRLRAADDPLRDLDCRRGGILHHGMRGRGCLADVDVRGAELSGRRAARPRNRRRRVARSISSSAPC